MSARLRHLAQINPVTPEFDQLADNAEIPFLPLEAIWPGDRFDSSRRRRKGEVSIGYTRFLEGDILLPKITPTFEADRTVIAKNIEGGVGVATTELHIIRVSQRADTRYVRYLLSSKPFLEEGKASMTGVAGQRRIPDDCLRNLHLPVIECNHQRAIANYLDVETTRITALIEKKRRMSDLLKERLSGEISVATAAHTIDNHSALPENWNLIRLRRCFTTMEYGIGTPALTTGQIAVLGMGNIAAHRIAGEPNGYVDDIDPQLLLRSGDLLFNRTNSLALVGKVALWLDTGQPTTFASYLVRLRVNSLADHRYLNYLLNSCEVLALASAMALPSIGQANLNPNRYASVKIPLPPIDLQRAIVDSLDHQFRAYNQAKRALMRQIELLIERRQAIITAAVIGELDIPKTAL